MAKSVLAEQRACRDDVVVFDQTSFAKFMFKGRDALAVLQRLCANELDVPIGRIVYTAMLNERGGFESDLTITRLGEHAFFILTGSGQATRDASWIGSRRSTWCLASASSRIAWRPGSTRSSWPGPSRPDRECRRANRTRG